MFLSDEFGQGYWTHASGQWLGLAPVFRFKVGKEGHEEDVGWGMG